jgi:hypothetical protein
MIPELLVDSGMGWRYSPGTIPTATLTVIKQ